MRLMHFGWIAVCTLVAVLRMQHAHAQIVKCKSNSGQASYTQGRCPDGTQPMDLPAGVAADAVGTSLPGSEPAPLTGRAAELQCLSDRCPGANGECRQYEAIEKLCSVQANWQTPDCVALRRQRQHYGDSLGHLLDDYKRENREKCQKGDKQACIKEACPTGLYTDATEAQVRNCSRVMGYPSGDNWAQYDRRTGPGGELYQFFCLSAVTTQTDIGSDLTMRATLQVTRRADSNRYVESGFRDREFDTVDQAASAGCAAKVAEYGLRVLSPKADRMGNDQAGYTKVDVVCTVKKPVRQNVLGTMRNTLSSVCVTEYGGGASQTISYLFAEEVGLVEEVFQLHQGPNVSGGEEPVRTVLIAVNKVAP